MSGAKPKTFPGLEFHELGLSSTFALSASLVVKKRIFWNSNKSWEGRPKEVILGALSESCSLSVGTIIAPVTVRPHAKRDARAKCKGHNCRQFENCHVPLTPLSPFIFSLKQNLTLSLTYPVRSLPIFHSSAASNLLLPSCASTFVPHSHSCSLLLFLDRLFVLSYFVHFGLIMLRFVFWFSLAFFVCVCYYAFTLSMCLCCICFWKFLPSSLSLHLWLSKFICFG